MHWGSGPAPPLPELLCPAWLLISSQLEVHGEARACGRDAFRVEATRRAGLNRRNVPSQFRGGHGEVMVDAELGILLRGAWLADGAEPEVTELITLDLDPVIDPALFMPPPGSLIAESTAEALGAGGAGWPLSWPLIFPAAVAVVDAGTGIALRLTSYIGEQPVRRCELRDTTATAGYPSQRLSGMLVYVHGEPRVTRDDLGRLTRVSAAEEIPPPERVWSDQDWLLILVADP